MTPEQVEVLFDEFALEYVRGERPDVRSYLERAGAAREELGRLIDRFLEALPVQPPSEEDVVLIQAGLEHEPPLLVLRKRRKLTRDAVVSALMTRLSLDPAKRGRVRGYYHRIEVGTLDPEPVDRRVWDVLADLLKANARSLAGPRPELQPAFDVSYRRSADHLAATPLALGKIEEIGRGKEASTPDPTEPDEIDRLFTGSA
jgi:hypothetical protein